MSIEKEVKYAYADCWMEDEKESFKIRDLNFRSSGYVAKEEAVKIMDTHIGGYNDFTPMILNYLPDDSQVCIAREGSVCVYVKSDTLKNTDELREKLKADEFDFKNGEYRIWWD